MRRKSYIFAYLGGFLPFGKNASSIPHPFGTGDLHRGNEALCFSCVVSFWATHFFVFGGEYRERNSMGGIQLIELDDIKTEEGILKMRKLVSTFLVLIIIFTIIPLTYADSPVVYDDTGFLIGYSDFAYLFDTKLAEITEYYEYKYPLSLEREDNDIRVGTFNGIRICYNGAPLTDWMKGTCAIFFNGITESLFTPTITQVQFGYDENHFLTNWSSHRNMVLAMFAAIPYTIDSSFSNPDEAVSFITDSLFDQLPNGKNIESYDPERPLPLKGLPVECEHNGVTYTLCDKNDTLYLIRTFPTS